ncbi:energy-coupling factor transport system permease protein [Clostridium tetanomorphum]|uniref:Energy-coupling factor transporter transmembrane protein EcfT n=1 Tax=Clostridium tetanomorphum TaxID=1553 RepID=A0A923J1H8_CLOTT|nr:energy-coupling factor transporter transmembrane component T [Clostridium tetanomorphum]KAJ50359.1 cobalt transport protein [Clostridium tetanomorphum DSM 665]MBC2397750.1 energy-coupling factor transporter transmembrane protein EcfT [Clostridium tetanomorphum]MBP1866027.1 energy-coupling factor transport system permease protein [Clostridium tetanomorphum]NRS83293.1 energy-coupling factor transport system permease protein [Clostridium tetanomorphum]NRZ96497.1 energy-coupling factor transpor
MLIYKNRNTFLQKLHPLTGILFLTVYIILFLQINNPIYLFTMLISLLILAYLDGSLKDLFTYGKIILPFALLIVILNPIMVHDGSTVIYEGHINYPVLGPMRITLEAVIYGIFNGIRVMCVTLTFGLGNLIIHPDRAFGFFSKFLKKSSLLMSMTIRLFPTMMTSYENIVNVEKLRGNKMLHKDMKKTIKASGNIVNILFLSSLEDSADMAESMYSRGYGALKKRSSYFHEKFTYRDIAFILIYICIFVYFQYFNFKGFNVLNFYPKVDNPIKALSIEGYILSIMMFVPSLIYWGWKNWK